MLAYSKVGSDQLQDLAKMRPKLLNRVRESLSGHVRPLVRRAVEAGKSPALVLPSGEELPRSSLSEEELQDTLRDFIKSDSQGMIDLREMQFISECLIRGRSRLRVFVISTIVLSGLFLSLAWLLKGQAFSMHAGWPHFVAFGVVATSVATALCCYFRVLHLSGSADRLTSQYADLP